MSKLDDLVEKYAADVEGISGAKLDKDLLLKVTKGCGPSIYRKDASLVAASDPKEVERMKQNFCIKKLGIEDSSALDDGIKEVFKQYDKRQKHRAVVYYLIVQKFSKASVYS